MGTPNGIAAPETNLPLAQDHVFSQPIIYLNGKILLISFTRIEESDIGMMLSHANPDLSFLIKELFSQFSNQVGSKHF